MNFQDACDALPTETMWSDPATPELVQHIYDKAFEAGVAHFQELLVATLAADFRYKDYDAALKFEREYPKTTELLKGI